MTDLEDFRKDAREWLAANCPLSMRGRSVHIEEVDEVYGTADARLWRERAAARGWIAPGWPKQYGGGGLNRIEQRVLREEMAAIKAVPPWMDLGLALLGPTLLELGTEAQKLRHIPGIARGEVRWCQGFSEPGAGSDLASLRTRAVLQGDHFVINGQKIWTSGATYADWMFCLVRTDPAAPKHSGITFVLLEMKQPGVSVKPIGLISGSSPFCETFFDDAIARKDDMVGELNQGWAVAKRLLQYERSGPGDAGNPPRGSRPELNAYAELALRYVGRDNGRIADPVLRDRVTRQVMQERCLQLTARRVAAESSSSGAPGAATSIFKYVGSTLSRDGSELKALVRGMRGIGWEGDGFSAEELEATRSWLRDRAVTIYGGSNEVQLNIIAKRVLGLPD